MKHLLKIALAMLLCCGFAACNNGANNDNTPARTSVVTLSQASVDMDYKAGSFARIKVSVPRFGWSAECEADWLTITPDSTSSVGTLEVMLVAEENSGEEARNTEVIFHSGNVSRTLSVHQVGYGQEVNDVNHPDGNANKWMFEILQKWYLWNDLLDNIFPDYACNFDNFLENTLIPLKGNELDGGKNDDGSRYLYSNVTRAETTSRASAGYAAFGFATMSPVLVDDNYVYLRVTSINPDSPADRAGIMRGEYIGRINDIELTRANWNIWYNRLMYPTSNSIKLTMMSSVEYAGEFYFSENRNVTLSAAQIGNNPVVATEIIEYEGRRVGYFAYNSFTRGPVEGSVEYDDEMEDAFYTFITEGIDELVIDLRYNGGGSVSSCQKLLSMIAPADKLGQKAFTMRYNPTISEQMTDASKTINLLSQYSDLNVNMNKVYVITSEQSASASEMVIVGLQGLDVAVTVVGLTTEGKNVGMDVISKQIDNYTYTFSPITFQIYNAKGYSEYSNGIPANYKIDEWEDLRSDGWKPLGDPEELMLKMVLNLIGGGRSSASATRSMPPPAGIQKIRFADPQKNSGALVYPDDTFGMN